MYHPPYSGPVKNIYNLIKFLPRYQAVEMEQHGRISMYGNHGPMPNSLAMSLHQLQLDIAWLGCAKLLKVGVDYMQPKMLQC
jgi:hypothetical protein